MASGFGRGFLVGMLVGGFCGVVLSGFAAALLAIVIGFGTLASVKSGGSFAPVALTQASIQDYRGQIGRNVTLTVTGDTFGPVYGTDLYTDDSDIGSAAVHAGVLRSGQTGTVTVSIQPGAAGYPGSARNGVVSMNWNTPWGGSFRFVKIAAGTEPKPAAVLAQVATPIPTPFSLADHRKDVGKTLQFELTGKSGGRAYGTDVYTDDSDLATAAVHAGALRDGEKGTVRVTIVAGQASYTGSVRNGVTTSDWKSPWDGSFRFESKVGEK